MIPATKPGVRGRLYRYAVEYSDPTDPGFGFYQWRTWAYSEEHALDLFLDADEGWIPIRVGVVGQRPGEVRWSKRGCT